MDGVGADRVRVAAEERAESAVAEFDEQGRESAEHAARFRAALDAKALATAEKRFAALGRVEARHAARYGAALEKLDGGER